MSNLVAESAATVPYGRSPAWVECSGFGKVLRSGKSSLLLTGQVKMIDREIEKRHHAAAAAGRI